MKVVGVVIGGLALARPASRFGTASRRLGAIVALVTGLPLGLPTLAKTVRASDGRAQVTDGPYLDAGRAVGGYFVFEADDLNAALRLASRSPAARLGSAVEVRPVAK